MSSAGPLGGGRAATVRPDDAPTRTVVESLTRLRWVPRADLVGVQGARPGSGRSDGEFWEAPGWFLKTRSTRRFRERAAAVGALEALAARREPLGSLVPARSALLLWETAYGDLQLWTLAPLLVTLREWLDAAAASRAWRDFARAIAAFASALGEALSVSIDVGLGLDANPANFAVQGARLRYLDDDVLDTRDALGLEDAFVARFGEYPAAPAEVWEAYARRFGDELAARVAPAAFARMRLGTRLRAAAGLRRAAGPHVERVLARLEARR